MGRTRRALILSGFTYAQSALSILSSLVLTRIWLDTLGDRVYGAWQATGALVAYAALTDLGVFAVLPWLIAEADGKKDTPGLRALLAHGLIAGLGVGVLFALATGGLWTGYASLLKLNAADQVLLLGPVVALVVLTAIGYPLKVFTGALTGLQDFAFIGTAGLLQVLLQIALSLGLLWKGHGLYGIALGNAVPPLLTSLASFVRLKTLRPQLLRAWPRIQLSRARPIFAGGLGTWLGTTGWLMAFSSNNALIGFLGQLPLVPMFAVTSRMGFILMQQSWALPDSGLVGLAQLAGEGLRERVRHVVAAMMRFHLIVSGGVACAVLALNPAFVRLWVGESRFGGLTLNAVFALDILALSFVHATVVPIGVLGHRLKIGAITLANGALHIALALVLGRVWGLVGVAAATVLSSCLTTLPVGLVLLPRTADLSSGTILYEVIARWAVRFVPIAGLSLFLGTQWRRLPAPLLICAALLMAVGYAFWMRPLYKDLPLPNRVRLTLARLRLL
ncbi:MAG: lipopolysaccharide biosynthesis protein [Myxococcaceae bacterium]